MVTHHPDQPWVGFSLFNGHLDHGTGGFLSQHHHGNALRNRAALPDLDREKDKRPANLSEVLNKNQKYLCLDLFLLSSFISL